MADKRLAMQCVQMLEKYLDEAKGLPNDNSKMLTLAGPDMAEWKSVYYPKLVESGKIRDGVFFQNPLKDLRYGIGNDGKCTKLEYFQFLWSAYKFALGDFAAENEALKYIKGCIKMLEPYAADFENRGTNPGISRDLKDADMAQWKDGYYLKLSKSGLVPDAAYFGGGAHLGIGSDGRFVGEELLHFLYRLYRLANTSLGKGCMLANAAFGGYELAPMEACGLPEEAAAGYSEVMKALVGADYTPVLYVGRQVVAGMNHMIICRQTIAVPGRPEHLVEVVINSAPTTGEWTLVSIERIV